MLALSGATGQALAGELNLASTSYSIAENASSFEVTVNRSGNVSVATSVTVRTLDGSAIGGQDFTSIATVLSWSAGDNTPKTATVSVNDNAVLDGSRTFTLQLENPTSDTLGASDSGTVTITDYEEGTLQFDLETSTVLESVGVFQVQVSRTQGDRGAVTVNVASSNGTAAAGQDYLAILATLEFADGETAKQIGVTILADDVGELTQTFTLTLAQPGGSALLGETTEQVVTIIDDDNDFTPALVALTFDDAMILQPDLVDLNQPSLGDSSVTFIDTINAIPVLSTTDLLASQDTATGVLSIPVGDQTFYLRPLSVVRAVAGTAPSIVIRDDQSGYMVTADGISIQFQPALRGLSVLQSALEEGGLPELTVTDEGNITVQINQGPPPLERDENNVLVINNSYYDRYNVRPFSVAAPSMETAAKASFLPHPLLPDETLLSIIFQENSAYLEQVLSPAPFMAGELEDLLESLPGISEVTVRNYGLVDLRYQGVLYSLFSDYIVRRYPDYSPSNQGIFVVADANGDGLDDINVVFSSGDQQVFYVMNHVPDPAD